MLARIAYELFWIGRSLARAEHTARMLDAAFRVNLQAGPDDATSTPLSWDSVLAIMGADAPEPEAPTGAAVARLLTLDRETPASIVSCVGRCRDAARTVRDVLSTEMWEVVNTFPLYLNAEDVDAALQRGPYSIYALVKERCALFWGLSAETMLRDEAEAFLDAGRQIESATMVLRMLRVAVPSDAPPQPRAGGAPIHGPEAVALLHAVGAVEAYRRSVTAPPDAFQVATFLLYERAYPHSVAAAIADLHDALATADLNARTSSPVLRLGRLMADLEFRRRAGEPAELPAVLRHAQSELARIDDDIERRYFAGAARLRQVVTT